MTTPVDPFAEMEARRVERLEEYGTWAAAEQIWVGASLAYDIGHPIPASNVEPDGSVVTLRHYCPPKLPGQPKCPIENNLVVSRSGPGAAVKVDEPTEEPAPPKKAAAKSAEKPTENKES